MSAPAFRADRDLLGIVTQRRQDRERFAAYRQHRPAAPPRWPSNLKPVVREMVDEWIEEKARKYRATIAPPTVPNGATVVDILAAVTEASGYAAADLLGPRRTYPLIRARQMAYHLLRVLRADMSLPMIGRAVGGRDHTSALAGLRRFDEFQGVEPLAGWMAHEAVRKLLGNTG
ncbi:Chromosomal replication initiator, DnaA C-terminal [uncultured Caudovirales phage]|uniref:Chromosomal replication initiator, DnaA C-terminal n=1 Tax=uncultured Caudovirales phage TaxID=2100421 RepID=A0A6J5NZB6_9CAUD|nr:Chromosomal replication initiator, DnaA C-terminal [uncultured Caudovirales phage]CAB4218070.1 Chromosomal replication initiator, DnaA C-terminal [uncultured Caudovirales phage]